MAVPSTVTANLDPARAAALRQALEAEGWSFGKPPHHSLWAASLPSVKVVMYASGKVVFQGRDASRAAEELLGTGATPSAPRMHLDVPTVGSDEAGKGDFLGPLVVAAALVRPGQEALLAELGVRDSKTMGDREAGELAGTIRSAFPCAVVAVPPPRYNELHGEMGRNLNRLLAWAHARAIEDVLGREDAADAGALVIDRFAAGDLMRRSLLARGGRLPLEERPRAEDHPAVAAASVLARAAFLDGLRRLGDAVGVPLAKGSGPPADAAGRRVLARGGRELLARVAKMHFRNAVKIGAAP